MLDTNDQHDFDGFVGLVKGKTVGIDATTLEANAAHWRDPSDSVLRVSSRP